MGRPGPAAAPDGGGPRVPRGRLPGRAEFRGRPLAQRRPGRHLVAAVRGRDAQRGRPPARLPGAARRRAGGGAGPVLPGGQPRRPLRRGLALPQRRRRPHLAGGARVPRGRDDGSAGGPIHPARRPGVRPGRPERVYVGVNVYAGDATGRTLSASRVQANADGGGTWADLGRRDLGEINDLALGVDGRSLYLATDRGLWRLRLDGVPPPRPPVQVPSPSG